MYSLRSMETDGLVVRTVYAEERAFQTMQGEIAVDWKRGAAILSVCALMYAGPIVPE